MPIAQLEAEVHAGRQLEATLRSRCALWALNACRQFVHDVETAESDCVEAVLQLGRKTAKIRERAEASGEQAFCTVAT